MSIRTFTLCVIGFIISSLPVQAASPKTNLERSFELSGMSAKLRRSEDWLSVELYSKTQGWLLIGFSHENSLEDADFKMFRESGTVWESSDRINVGGRNYPADAARGGTNDIHEVTDISVKDLKGVSFTIPIVAADDNDFDHSRFKSYYVFLAWSTDKEWMHHSRERVHFPINW